MRNYVQPGEHLTLTMPAAVASGEGVLIGTLFGIAQGNCPPNQQVVLVRRGVFDLPKLVAQAWTVGAKVYWNNTDKVCTTVASGNTAIGAAVEPAADPSAVGRVLLDGMIR